MTKPSIAELLNASGHTTYTSELVQQAMYALYGNIGANLDERDWSAIMQSGNPLATAQTSLLAMYQSSSYLLRNTQHLEQSGYVAAQGEITYRQMADRLGFSYSSDWSVGTSYAYLGQLSTGQLIALVPVTSPQPPTDSIFTVSAGHTYSGTAGVNDLFKSTIADLNGTTIAGNAADTDTLTLTTAGTVTLNNGSTGGTISNIKVLNLANGTNTISYDASAGFTTINGGTGDDTFIPNTALLPIAVNGGNGTDTIVLTAAYAATASGNSTFATNVTGFEKLRLTGATNQTIDLQALGNYNDVALAGSNGLTLSNLASNGHVTLTGAGAALTLSNAAFAGAPNDVVNLALTDASGAGVAFASTGITASRVETANISVNDTQATPTGSFNNTVTWLGNDVKTIHASGNAGLALSATSTELTTVDASGITLGGFTWTASALTGTATVKGSATGTNTVNMISATVGVNYTGGAGNDIISGSARNDIISGGDGNDTITGNGGADTLTGGGGIDNFNFASGNSTLAQLATISDYRVGGADTITLTDVTAVASNFNTVQNLSAWASLNDCLNTFANVATTNNGLGVFIWGGDTYVYIESTGSNMIYASSDTVIKLTGTPFSPGTSISGLGIDGV